MKKTLFWALIALTSAIVSCKDSIGVDGPDGLELLPSETVMEEENYVAKFDTRVAEVYTVEQSNSGRVAVLRGDEIVSQRKFKRDLDLNALFSRPKPVYVSRPEQLYVISLEDFGDSDPSVARTNDTDFVRIATRRGFRFQFDGGEEIATETMYEKDVLAKKEESELRYTAIRNVQFTSATSEMDEVLSNKDSLVYNVELGFRVELMRYVEGEEEGRMETHNVVVPEIRIYKTGYTEPDPDVKKGDILESVKREIVNGVDRITVVTAEEWTVSGKKNPSTEVIELPVNFVSPAKKTVYTDNVTYVTTPNGKKDGSENVEMQGCWEVTTKPFVYTSTATNETNPFNNVYQGESGKVTFVKGSIRLEFAYGKWVITEGETTITGPKTEIREGVTYEVYEYTNNVNWLYSIEEDPYVVAGSASIGGGRRSEAELLMTKADVKVADKLESATREIISATAERITVKTYEEWSVSGKKNSHTETFEMPIGFSAPAYREFFTNNAEYTTKTVGKANGQEGSSEEGNWTVKTKPFTYSSKADNGSNPFNNVYDGSSCAVVYTKGSLEIEFGFGTWTITEGETTIKAQGDVTRDGKPYTAYLYTNNIRWTYSIAADPYAVKERSTTSASAKAEVLLLIGKADVKISDEVSDIRREIVSPTVERLTVTTYENWSVSGKKNEVSESIDLPIAFASPAAQEVYTSNANYTTNGNGIKNAAETSKVDGNWTVKTKPFTYSSTANNSADPFNNAYQGSSSAAVYTKGSVKVEFGYGTWTVNEGRTTISSDPKTVNRNGKTYEAYDYVNNVNWTYSVANDPYVVSGKAQTANSAKAEATILIEKEEDVKKGDILVSAKREVISSTKERLTVTTAEEWSVSGTKNQKTETIDLTIGFDGPAAKEIFTDNKGYTTTSNGKSNGSETSKVDGNWTIKSKTFGYSSTAKNGSNPFDNNYQGVSSAAVYQKGNVKVEFGFGTWTVKEGQTTISSNPSTVNRNGKTYEAYDYVNNVNWTYSVANDPYAVGTSQTNGNEAANVKILIEKREDRLTGMEAQNVQHEILDENRDRFTWDEVEHWSESGDKTTKKEWIRYRHFNEPAKLTVYTSHTGYNTKANGHTFVKDESSTAMNGNLKITTRYAKYSSTSSNNVDPFDNVYTYDHQAGVYNNGYYTLNFDFGKFDVTEKGSSVGSSTKNGNYMVSTHINNVAHVYTAEGKKFESTAKALADLYVKHVEKNLPESWGDIVSFAVTAVPADDVQGQYAKKAFCLVTTKGAVSVVTSMDTDLPTLEQIKAGYFVQGDFNGYNSAFWTTSSNNNGLANGKWAPAVAQDNQGVMYTYKGKGVRLVLTQNLKIWNWRNGNYSVVVNGYKATVDNDKVLTVTYNGKTLNLK